LDGGDETRGNEDILIDAAEEENLWFGHSEWKLLGDDMEEKREREGGRE